MKLKSSKTTCNFKHAVLLVIVCRLFLLKSVCHLSQSIKTHNTPTFYSNAYNRTGMKLNFFLGEVALWYSIYVLLARIRTTWVETTYLFTYALTAKSKHSGLHKSVNQKGPLLWSKRSKIGSSIYTYVVLRNLAGSKFGWNSVELSKLKANFIFLDKLQWTLKSSHKDIRTTVFVLRCRHKARQFKAHSNNKRVLETNFLDSK